MRGAAGHWDRVYGRTPLTAVSWYEDSPATSLRLVAATATRADAVVDVGAGASALVDALLDCGFGDVTVLDVSRQALDLVRSRLGNRSGASFVAADLLRWRPPRQYHCWHDRAVFHFLTSAEDQQSYVHRAAEGVVAGGAAVLGVFAQDGPEQCSGLPTARYDAATLADLFAPAFVLEHSEREEHVTPAGKVQPFTWVVLRRAG